jgi:hypothetical protein
MRDADVFALPRDDAAVGLMHAGEHLDQGGFARAVLAQNTMHLGRAHLEVDPFESLHTGETLGDFPHSQKWRRMVVVDHAGNITHTYVEPRG